MIPGFIVSMLAILIVSSVTADAGEYQHINR